MKEMPAAERPREKLFDQGAEALSNAELIAALIGSGTRDASAVTVAGRLLAMDPSGIRYLEECSPEELCRIEGIGSAKAAVLLAAVELGRRIMTTPRSKKLDVSSPARVAELYMEQMRYMHQEHFRVLMLNVKNEIIMSKEISKGSISSSEAHPRDVFATPIRRGAANIILVHNHPSGNPEPSRADVRLTDRLAQAGVLLGVGVLDHIIIGDGVFVSMREAGLIQD